MHSVVLAGQADFAGWRSHSRALLTQGVPPKAIVWSVAEEPPDLFAPAESAEPQPTPAAAAPLVPRAFVDLAEEVIQHRDPERFGLLYRLLWRLAHGERGLLAISVDPDVHRLEAMAKSVRRDTHKMRGFVRFREVEHEGEAYYLAWFEPDHFIVEANAVFFARRFASMRWSILTPYRSVHWDKSELRFGPGAARGDVPTEDALEEHWRAYYASVFNPARLKLAAMRSEMPKKYWANLPEARMIEPLAREAAARAGAMLADSATEPARKGRVQLPQDEAGNAGAIGGTLEGLRAQARRCQACPLWGPATQMVFGEGPADAPIMLVGEQPGDQEDLAGRPFVGPAGKMLDQALAEAGIDRSRTYVTNAVKHFKFTPRGKRRLHQKPDAAEIQVCGRWLAGEIELVRPRLLVALGATAAQALFGRTMRIGEVRGRVMPLDDSRRALVTVHPSYLLRLPDEAVRQAEYHRFVADLRLASDAMAA